MGHVYLIIVDSHLKWLDVQIMQSVSTSKTVEKLRFVFATHGLPPTIVSDNGPSFTSDEFKKSMQANGIRLHLHLIIHLQIDWQRELFKLKQGLKQINGNSVEEKLSRFLLKYRITQHTTTGIPSSELLMGCRLRLRLNLLHPDLSGHVEERQWKQKKIHDKEKTLRKFKEGDQEYVEDFSASKKKIDTRSGRESYLTTVLPYSTP